MFCYKKLGPKKITLSHVRKKLKSATAVVNNRIETSHLCHHVKGSSRHHTPTVLFITEMGMWTICPKLPVSKTSPNVVISVVYVALKVNVKFCDCIGLTVNVKGMILKDTLPGFVQVNSYISDSLATFVTMRGTIRVPNRSAMVMEGKLRSVGFAPGRASEQIPPVVLYTARALTPCTEHRKLM